MNRIYMDYAAATPLDARVKEAMEPYWSEHFGNAGSLHEEGQIAKRAIEEARATCARALRAHPDEIIFTSSGTESNNLALMGLVRALRKEGRLAQDMHIIMSAIEHSSVADVCAELARDGAHITTLPVDARGAVDARALREALRKETVLVSLMHVNNEIGSVMPVRELAKEVRRARKMFHSPFPYLHTDACQSFSVMPVHADVLGVDFISLDAQKIYGPKGAGLLYRRRAVPLAPIFFGGGFEKGLRPSTPPTPLIVGLGRAVALIEVEREETVARLSALQHYFLAELSARVPRASLNGSMEGRAPNNINISILGMESAMLVLQLNARGIAASARSACFFDVEEGSRVVRALGKGEAYAQSAVRFTFGVHTTQEDIARVVDALEEIVEKGHV